MEETSLEARQAEMRARLRHQRGRRKGKQVLEAEQRSKLDVENHPEDLEAPDGFGIKRDRTGTSISRSQLYLLVWAEPMLKAAERFGVSDVAVAKACRRQKIPVPGRGYWARLAAGQNPPRLRLPSGDDSLRVTFGLQTERVEPEIIEVKATERIAIEPPGARLHPLAKETKHSVKAKDADQIGRCYTALGLLDIRVSFGQIDRATRISSALLKAAELRGYQVVRGSTSYSADKHERKAKLKVVGIEISFEIQERIRQIRHVPTEKEKLAMAKTVFHSVPKFDFHPSGELTFRITRPWVSKIQTTWTDGKRQNIDGCLGDILETFSVVAEAEHESRRRKAEEQQREMERQRLRWEEESRVKRFEGQLTEWKKAKDARLYADAVEAAVIGRAGKLEPTSELGRWVAWMRKLADQIDPSGREDIGRERSWW